MIYHASLVDPVAAFTGTILATALFVAALRRAASVASITRREASLVLAVVTSCLALWFVLVVLFAAKGAFEATPHATFPSLGLALLLPFGTATIAARLWKPLAETIGRIPQQHLIGIQGFRVIGFTFLGLMAEHLLPWQFALPAGLGDVLVGLEALVIMRMFVTGSARAPLFAYGWNIFGVLDLLVAISIAALAATSPIRVLDLTPSTDLLTVMPMVIIPAFGVPFFLALHVFSIARLRQERPPVENMQTAQPFSALM